MARYTQQVGGRARFQTGGSSILDMLECTSRMGQTAVVRLKPWHVMASLLSLMTPGHVGFSQALPALPVWTRGGPTSSDFRGANPGDSKGLSNPKPLAFPPCP